MVTIIDYKKRQNGEGKDFMTLVLQGDIELIRSSQTGKFYATARKTSITTTFEEVTCKALVGKTLPGAIEKVSCEPYDYTVQETGEVIQLDFNYQYVPEKTSSMEESVFNAPAVTA